jgi:hypothetical protein
MDTIDSQFRVFGGSRAGNVGPRDNLIGLSGQRWQTSGESPIGPRISYAPRSTTPSQSTQTSHPSSTEKYSVPPTRRRTLPSLLQKICRWRSVLEGGGARRFQLPTDELFAGLARTSSRPKHKSVIEAADSSPRSLFRVGVRCSRSATSSLDRPIHFGILTAYLSTTFTFEGASDDRL